MTNVTVTDVLEIMNEADVQLNATGNASSANAAHNEALLAACLELQPAAHVYLLLLPLWIVSMILWSSAVWGWGRAYTLELHRTLTWIPTIEIVHGGLSTLHYLFCPWRATTEKIIGAAWVVVAILKEPIMLVCLLLVSKGWCITRPRLENTELMHTALVSSALYASVIIQMSLPRTLGIAALLAATFLMLSYSIASILTNLRVLKAQLLALRALNIDATTTPVYVKYRMFAWLLVYTTLYFLANLAIQITNVASPHAPWSAALTSQILEFLAAASIGAVFRPRPFNVLFEQVSAMIVTGPPCNSATLQPCNPAAHGALQPS